MSRFPLILAVALFPSLLMSQSVEKVNRLNVWFPLQIIPSMTLYSFPTNSAFGFEWEMTPVLYSFGINRRVSPWYSFIVEPTARFSGSVELTVAGQVFTSKPGRSYFGSTVQVMGFIPVFELGEQLTLNVGAGTFRTGGLSLYYTAAGVSSVFGMVHLNVKHAANPETWVGSLEVRIF